IFTKLMFIHYLKIAFRNIKKQKMFSFIKIAGFAIGIAACLLIGLYVYNELNYDKANPNRDRVFRIIGESTINGISHKGISFPAPMAKALVSNFPEIEKAGRIMPNALFGGAGANQIRRADKLDNSYEKGFCFADQEIMDILHIPIIKGDQAHA